MNQILEYLIPLIICVIASVSMYLVTPNSNEHKNDFINILIRNILPGISIGILTYLIIKNKSFNKYNEPLMSGNYFD
jgi:hypothetical protein